jgi:hypothetical protein
LDYPSLTATQVESPVRQLVYRLKAGGFDAGYEAESGATTDEPDDLDLKPPRCRLNSSAIVSPETLLDHFARGCMLSARHIR